MLEEPRASRGELGHDQLPGVGSVAHYEQHGQPCPVPFEEGQLGSLGTFPGSGRMELWWSELPKGQRVTRSCSPEPIQIALAPTPMQVTLRVAIPPHPVQSICQSGQVGTTP